MIEEDEAGSADRLSTVPRNRVRNSIPIRGTYSHWFSVQTKYTQQTSSMWLRKRSLPLPKGDERTAICTTSCRYMTTRSEGLATRKAPSLLPGRLFCWSCSFCEKRRRISPYAPTPSVRVPLRMGRPPEQRRWRLRGQMKRLRRLPPGTRGPVTESNTPRGIFPAPPHAQTSLIDGGAGASAEPRAPAASNTEPMKPSRRHRRHLHGYARTERHIPCAPPPPDQSYRQPGGGRRGAASAGREMNCASEHPPRYPLHLHGLSQTTRNPSYDPSPPDMPYCWRGGGRRGAAGTSIAKERFSEGSRQVSPSQ